MSDDLRFRLGQASVEPKRRLEATSPDVANVRREWQYKSWAEAVDAFNRYENLPDLSFPVVISQNGGSINTPERLQEVANLPQAPEAIDATIVKRTGEVAGQNVQIGLIGWEEIKLLKRRTDFKQIFVRFAASADDEPTISPAVFVTSLIEGWERRPWIPWAPKTWAAVMDAFARSGLDFNPGRPVLVNGPTQDNPIDSAETLQKLLGLSESPLLTTTRLTRRAGDWSGAEVKVADIDYSSWWELYKLANLENAYIWFPDGSAEFILPRKAYVVQSLRETRFEENGEKWQGWGTPAAAKFMEEEAKLPPRRFPVIIKKPGEESSLSLDGIKRLIGLPATPEVTTTTITESLDGEDGMEAHIISLNSEEADLLRQRTLNEHDHCVWYPDRRTGKPMVRRAMLLKRPLDRWAASLEWEESVERGDDADDASSSSG